VPEAGARSFSNNGWLRPVAEGERSEGRGGGLRGTSTRSHGAQAGRSATKEPDFARRAMDSRRHTKRHRANRAERDSQPPGCPKGEGPVRRDLRQRGGLQRHGLAESGNSLTSHAPPPP
jgi:hypothetical protein